MRFLLFFVPRVAAELPQSCRRAAASLLYHCCITAASLLFTREKHEGNTKTERELNELKVGINVVRVRPRERMHVSVRFALK